MKTVLKRGAAGLLAVLLCLFAFSGTGALAAETCLSYMLSYPRDGDACPVYSTDAWGHEAKTYMNGWSVSANDVWNVHCQDSFEGQINYCIEPGVIRNIGDVCQGFGEDFWDNYPAEFNPTIDPGTIKLLLGRVMQYGYQGNVSASWQSQNEADAECLAWIMATQVLVWETVVGERDENFAHMNPAPYDAVKSVIGPGNPVYERFLDYYDWIVACVQSHTSVPSFMSRSPYSAQTAELEWDGSCYSAELYDYNGVADMFTFYCDEPGMELSVSGNSLMITCSEAPAGTVGISAEKGQMRAGVLVWTDGIFGTAGGIQDVVTYSAAASDPVAAFLNVKVSGGGIRITKSSEDGNVSGVSFTVSGAGTEQTVTTGYDGTALVSGLLPGTYTVTEDVPGWYEPQASQTAEVQAGQLADLSFYNVLKRGDLKVTKDSEDGLNEGVGFRLYGTSHSGAYVNEYAVTDSNGEAYFANIPVGSYTLEEEDTAIRYVVPEAQSAAVEWNAVTQTAVANVLKKFRVVLTKTDEETGTPRGDATLAGAVYGLYRGEELVASYTTDGNGRIVTDYHPCGEDWTVREIAPSDGYLLDEGVYPVGAAPELYTVEHNEVPMDVTEKLIKGSFCVIKHRDNGDTGIETPEAGAEFTFWLKSAGSYEAAKEDERGVLVCDANGYAGSAELPYGTYLVRQTKGAEGTELMPDFVVFISEDGKTYRYLLNNAVFESFIKVVKTDAETGRTIPYAGAGFQIRDPEGNLVVMTCTYPEHAVLDTFYTSAGGSLITPEKLPYGTGYTLTEVQAPWGYVLDPEPVAFDVVPDASGNDGDITLITVCKTDAPQKGVVSIFKTGEAFSSVTEENGLYRPVYGVRGLAGAEYEIRAAEDIVTPDGTLRYEEGTVVETVTTGEDGVAVSGELYLGRYAVKEVRAPYGYVLDAEEHIAELTYAGQEIALTETSLTLADERQKAAVSIDKYMECDPVFGVYGSFGSVVFGLYAAEEIGAPDGAVIPADGLLARASCDGSGTAVFECEMPAGTEMYVKEISTDWAYYTSGEKYPVVFGYAGEEVPVVEIKANGGNAVGNWIIRGAVRGLKTDEDGGAVKGVLFGLFFTGETEFTEETALMTCETDENGIFVFTGIPYGDYLVREIRAAEGFVLEETPRRISVNGGITETGFENVHVTGSVELTKTDADYPDNRLTGAVFEVYADLDGDGRFSQGTDVLVGETEEVETGVYRLDGLRAGSYLVYEKTAPEGFIKDRNYYAFMIGPDGGTVTVENGAGHGFVNRARKGNVRIEKTSDDGVLEGFTFRISGTDTYGNGFSGEYVTGPDGKILIEGLRTGEYTVSEVRNEKSEKYELPPDVTLSVLEDATTVAVFHNALRYGGESTVPRTGDRTNVVLWASVAAASLAGAAALGVSALKKKEDADER